MVLAGCAAMATGGGSTGLDAARTLCADVLAPQALKFSLPSLLHPHLTSGGKLPPQPEHPIPRFTTVRARVRVQDGCDCSCAYCIVPKVRGPSVSRPIREIVEEVSQLGKADFKEIILTGANLGCYKDGKRNIVHLLEAIHEVDTVSRIRLSSIEPGTSERAVIDFMAQSPKVCRHLHIPLQSGDDRILSRMGRTHTVAGFRASVDHALDKLGHIGLGTDLITGLPGEDDAAFQATCRIVDSLPFSNIHVFAYSRRPGTAASSMPNQLPEAVKTLRARLLLKLATTAKKAFLNGCIGHTVSVLVERVESARLGTGWTAEYARARVSGSGIARNKIVTGTATGVEHGLLNVEVS